MKKWLAAAIALVSCLVIFGTALAEPYMDNETVLAVQEALNAAGFNCGRADGMLGSRTVNAIMEYQKSQGLKATGTITNKVLVSLGLVEKEDAQAGEPYTDIETVLTVQEALNAAGFDCGTADGIAGSRTANAITEYQKSQGLKETGTITDEVLAALGLVQAAEEEPEADGVQTMNIEIVGARNLLLNSEAKKEIKQSASENNTATYNLADSFYETDATQWICSFDAKSTADVQVNAYFRSDSKGIGGSFNMADGRVLTILVSDTYKRYYLVCNTEGVNLSKASQFRLRVLAGETGGKVTIRNVKLERGTIATDWTPAPEDMEFRVAELEARLAALEGEDS